DTSKFPDYGALTGGSLSGQRAGARVEYNDPKRNPTDFALWKYSPKDVKRQMEWNSPWGVGFPGWHTECCVMSMKLLGEHFDIHTGGEDLSRVHHTNEIAQSEPIVGKPWVHYWVHFGFLLDKSGEKMAKSKGEFLGMNALRDRNIEPIIYRYWITLGHFQSQMAFSFDALEAAAAGYKNIIRRVADLIPQKTGNIDKTLYDTWHDKLLAPVSDNMKTAESLVVFQDLLKDKEINADTKLALVDFVDDLLGLLFMEHAKKLHVLESETAPDNIQEMAQKRLDAKKARDFATADELRAQIDGAGWSVMDTADGFKLVRKQ
ncbi:MAG: cysteine--tRNA ligase, partial [Alphaproteobacteria bacterium]|nr:cysteine--tRNA ligase [Alphaproteobacteria bacterium]